MNERQSGREEGRRVPQDLWAVSAQLKYNDPLQPMDPLWEDTSPGRDLGYDRMYKSLGVDARAADPKDWLLRAEPSRHYGVFCGHRGSGKSTELRLIRERLHRPALFHVVFLDVLEVLDVNNLQYPDLFLALATRLFETVKEAGVELEEALRIRMEEELPVYERLGDVRSRIVTGYKVALAMARRGGSGDAAEASRLLLWSQGEARRLGLPFAEQIEAGMRSLGLSTPGETPSPTASSQGVP